MTDAPFSVVADDLDGLWYLDAEVSYGSTWISLNDGERYKLSATNTRDNSSKTWRKITAQSPVLGGTYLVHAVPELITEQVSVYVYGNNQTDLNDNFWFLDELFEQPSFRLRWTTNEYREYWDCQLADGAYSRNQVWTHSAMAVSTYSVPRFPRVTRERV